MILARHSLTSILLNRFKIKHAPLSELLEIDRATVYHASKVVEQQLRIGAPMYITAVERWIPIIDSLSKEIESTEKTVRRSSIEELILMYLSGYSVDESKAILRRVYKEVATAKAE